MPFKCKSKTTFHPIADVIEKVIKEEMHDGCITHRVVREVIKKTNDVPFSHGGIHHIAVTGEPVRKVSTQVLTPDRFEELSCAPDDLNV